MRDFRADLHIHSRFSRATSKNLCIRNLSAYAQLKGLDVIGTGDFTHPKWREELERDLIWDETTGLYRPRQKLTDADIEAETGLAHPAGHDPLFLLQAEISSIYKKNGKVHKVHNLVFMPDLESVDHLNHKLAVIGNLASDGRPILGLDSERLLEIVLETSDQAVLIPAHIWTPWFSLFGSKSGFDSIEECFGDLSSHIFAMETGLSSDPDMNRLLSSLDRYVMVSNSDAHSGENLGREANLFRGEPSYNGIFSALRYAASKRFQLIKSNDLPEETPPSDCIYQGTLEFFPEEGKYHLDGHRNCQVVLDPQKERYPGDICPVCGKPMTVGVLHRVLDLADRKKPVYTQDEPHFATLIPLSEVIGEILDVGSKSRKVRQQQAKLTQQFGSELNILHHVPESDLRSYWEIFGEAIARMRAGNVIKEGGYDGEYGVIRVFTKQERMSFNMGQLVTVPEKIVPTIQEEQKSREISKEIKKFFWTDAQKAAIESQNDPILVFAGPGSGKTRTLIGRIQFLLQSTRPEQILAITFTRRAAAELQERLNLVIQPEMQNLICADTLHAIALAQRKDEILPQVLSEEGSRNLFIKANSEYSAGQAREAWERFSLAREKMENMTDIVEFPHLSQMAQQYIEIKKSRHIIDYTDLLEDWLLELMGSKKDIAWTEILVDEVQDMSPLQLAIIRALVPSSGKGFFGIGDPDQSIYSFRGACPDIQSVLQKFWSNLHMLALRESHRSDQEILQSANALLGAKAHCGQLTSTKTEHAFLHEFEAPDAEKEAAWIAEQIHRLIGETSHSLQDVLSSKKQMASFCSPGEIAVLVRAKSLIPPIQKALEFRGIPCSVPEKDPFWTNPHIASLLALAEQHFNRPLVAGSVENLDSFTETLPDILWTDGPSLLLRHSRFNTLFPESSAFEDLIKAYKDQGSWEALLDWIYLRQDIDAVKVEAEFVQIMTLHASKGLEFQAIFMPALEDGFLPFVPAKSLLQGNIQTENEDEERRLFYVGLTRAKQSVFLSHAQKRTLYGRTLNLQPSRFLVSVKKFFRHSHIVRRVKTEVTQISFLH